MGKLTLRTRDKAYGQSTRAAGLDRGGRAEWGTQAGTVGLLIAQKEQTQWKIKRQPRPASRSLSPASSGNKEKGEGQSLTQARETPICGCPKAARDWLERHGEGCHGY